MSTNYVPSTEGKKAQLVTFIEGLHQVLWAELCFSQLHMLKFQPSIPQHVTILRHRVVKEVIKFTEVMRVGPHMTWLMSL